MAKMTINEAAQILGISLNATPAQLKKAYRALCKKYHPDKNPGDKHAEDMFKKVAEANEVFLEYLERGGNSNLGNGGNNSGQSSNGGTRPGSGGGTRPGAETGTSGTRPGNNTGGGAGRTGSTGVNIDSILKAFWQNYQRAKRDHENFIHGELAATRQKVKDIESKLVQADNLDKKLDCVQTLQRLLMQQKMQVARAVMLAKTAELYLKQYQDASARFNQTNKQGGR